MKRSILLLLAVGSLAFTACNNDDDDNATQNDDNAVGVYRLASFNAPSAQDLDGDGATSGDLASEFDCYANWEIVLHQDHTFMRTYNVTDAVDGQLTCQTGQTSTGTWIRSGQTLTLTNALGEDETATTYTFSADNAILTQTGQGQFPTIFEDIFVMEPGTVTVVYAKQDDTMQR
ncbi:MAG TPA: lipocalin family protein [Flavobacterium sp.]|jgi:hypothetical protein